MRKFCRNLESFVVRPPVNKEGRIIRKPVDQTPASRFFRDKSGFFESDIKMLVDASSSGDKGRFEQLLSRIQLLEPEKQSKTVKELFDAWRPANVQTASEEQAWIRYIKEFSPDVYARLYPDGESNESPDGVQSSTAIDNQESV